MDLHVQRQLPLKLVLSAAFIAELSLTLALHN